MLSESSSTSHLIYSSEEDAPLPKMLFLGFVLLLPVLLCGMITTYPSVALPQMHMPLDYSSTFGPLAYLLSPIGSIVVGFVIDEYGRRPALLFSILPGIVGWLLLYWNHDVATVFLGQILNGTVCGAVGYPSLVYAGECVMANDIRMRNRFLLWIAISNAFGMFLTYLLGYFVDHRRIAAVGLAVAAVAFALVFAFVPESPLWLYLQGRAGDAEWSQKRLGIHPSTSDRRRVSVLLADERAGVRSSRWSAAKHVVRKLRRKDVYKPLIIAVTMTVCLSFIGGMSVVFYMVDIIKQPLKPPLYVSPRCRIYFAVADDGDDDNRSSTTTTTMATMSQHHQQHQQQTAINDAYFYSVISGALTVVANVIMSLLLPSVGVKCVLIVPLLCMAVGMAVEGYVAQQPFVTALYPWHLAAVWLVTFMYTSSVLMIPDTMTGDLFPVDAKGFASVSFLVESTLVALVSKYHPYAFEMVRGYLFYFYGAMCVISAAFVHVFIPEIVGKTLLQINDEFRD